jgi:hypothetical protein
MALATAGADSSRIYDELLVTTSEEIHPGILENAINSHPIASICFGRIGAALSGKIGEDGAPGSAAESCSGESIRVNVKLGKNGSFGWMAGGYDPINMDTSDTARGTRANFKLGAGSVVISGSERRKNSGAAQVASLLKHKQEDSVSSAVDTVAEALLAGTSLPNSITSIDSIISANDEIQNLTGASTGFANWNSRGVSAKGTAAASISFASGSFASQGASDMRAAWMGAEEGSTHPDCIVTTDLIHQYYEGSLTPDVRFNDTAMGDIGFNALTFKKAPIFHDPYCTSGSMYFLNMDHLFFKHLPGALFDLSQMERGTNQDAFVAHVILEANIVTNGRKFLNKLESITA